MQNLSLTLDSLNQSRILIRFLGDLYAHFSLRNTRGKDRVKIHSRVWNWVRRLGSQEQKIIVFSGKRIAFLDKFSFKELRISKWKIDHQLVGNHRTCWSHKRLEQWCSQVPSLMDEETGICMGESSPLSWRYPSPSGVLRAALLLSTESLDPLGFSSCIETHYTSVSSSELDIQVRFSRIKSELSS